MWVQNEDKSYRPLDMRTIRALRMADTHSRGVKSIVDDFIDEQERNDRQTDKEQVETIRETTREMAEMVAETVEEDYSDIGTANIPKEDLTPNLTEEEMDTWAP
jgi:hypothetical protein